MTVVLLAAALAVLAGLLGAPVAASAPGAPAVRSSWQGPAAPDRDADDPGDGAVSPTRFLELDDRGYALYARGQEVPAQHGTLRDLFGCSAACDESSWARPQALWDPRTSRFYYSGVQYVDSATSYVAFGWSRTDDPVTGGWCRYRTRTRYDEPFFFVSSLGDTADHLVLAGGATGATAAQVRTVRKPAAGTSCAAAPVLSRSTSGFTDGQGGPATDLVAVSQTDASGTGWLLGLATGSQTAGQGTRRSLLLFRVSESATGVTVGTVPRELAVRAFDAPPTVPADQHWVSAGAGLLREAVSAVDPAHGGRTAIWTQHTVRGGGGAEVRWYEIDGSRAALLQHGVLTGPDVSYLNATVAPDRAVRDGRGRFGDAMVLTADRVSWAAPDRVVVVSKVGTAAQSAPVVVPTGSGRSLDCGSGDVGCDWSGAASSPDPAPPAGAGRGLVWSTSLVPAPSSSGVSSSLSCWVVVTRP